MNIKYFLKLFLFSFLISFPVFLPIVKGATLTPKSTYTNNTNHIIGQDISSFGTSSTYSYSTVLPNLYGEFLWENVATGTAVSGKAYAFSLGFDYNLSAQKYYDITINFRDRDLRSVVNTSSIYLLGGTTISSMSASNLSLIGVTNSATSSTNTNKLIVRVYSVQAISHFVLQIYDTQNNITSVNNFGISSVSISEVDITNSQAIINNQTNNTQNVINNNNENTQQIIDNQNELLGSKCNNMLNPTTTSSGILCNGNGNICNSGNSTITKKDIDNGQVNISTTNTWAGFYFSYIEIDPNTTYYVKYSTSISDNYAKVAFYDSSNTYISELNYSQNYNFNFTTPSDAKYLRLSISNRNNGVNFNITNMSLNKVNTSFCAYGSYNSKLDDTTNAITDVNDSLNNNEVDDPTGFIDDMQEFLPTNGTITQLITLPISLFQKVLSSINGTCQSFALGNLYGTDLIMPCIDIGSYLGNTLWTTIDLIISGVFVLTIAKKMIKAFNSFTFMKEGDVIND